MSASEVIPAWRCKFPRCEQPLAFGSTTRCYYHGKLEEGDMLNGADSRRGIGSHSPRPRRHYDYAVWFDGLPHTLTWPADFEPDVKPMLNLIRKAARKRGIEIDIHAEGGYHGTITVQAMPKQEAGTA